MGEPVPWVRVWLGGLMFCFALGSWTAVNGVFAENGRLVVSQPEGNALPAQLNLAVQTSNVFLAAYFVYVVCLARRVRRELVFVLLIMTVCIGGLVLLALFWHATAFVGGRERSVGLLALTVLVGSANTLSSPIFFPILTQYPAGYTTAFAAGEASTGLLAGVLAVIQAAIGSAFTTSAYFAVLAVIQASALAAYLFLRYLPEGKALREMHAAQPVEDEEVVPLNADVPPPPLDPNTTPWAQTAVLLWRELLVTFWLNWTETGALTSLISYCLTPYGASFYKAALWGGMIMAPLGSMLTLVFVIGEVWYYSVVWAPLGIFLIVNSFVGLLVSNSVFGGFVVACAMICKLFLGYNKALIYIRVQQRDIKQSGGMFLVAIVQQIGAVSGSLIFFFIISYSGVFAT